MVFKTFRRVGEHGHWYEKKRLRCVHRVSREKWEGSKGDTHAEVVPLTFIQWMVRGQLCNLCGATWMCTRPINEGERNPLPSKAVWVRHSVVAAIRSCRLFRHATIASTNLFIGGQCRIILRGRLAGGCMEEMATNPGIVSSPEISTSCVS